MNVCATDPCLIETYEGKRKIGKAGLEGYGQEFPCLVSIDKKKSEFKGVYYLGFEWDRVTTVNTYGGIKNVVFGGSVGVGYDDWITVGEDVGLVVGEVMEGSVIVAEDLEEDTTTPELPIYEFEEEEITRLLVETGRRHETLIKLASKLFEGSRPMTAIEEKTLTNYYKKRFKKVG